MSSYLAQRVETTENIEVLLHTEVRRMLGDQQLEAVEVENIQTGETRTVVTTAVFTFIGAIPRTDWLPAEINTNSRGFVLTGPDVAGSPQWSTGRAPFLLETSRAGVFAAGDVRVGSINGVASAVGEGAMAIKFIHEYLAGV
jgi:thioredoxin reductase (NADPH)